MKINDGENMQKWMLNCGCIEMVNCNFTELYAISHK